MIRTHGSLSVIGAGASVGPFAYLRPGTTLGAGGKIGTFVETKNAQIGAGAKVPHLSYAGDTEIGEGANIGAGVIFANYDGVEQVHHARSGAFSFVGSNSVLDRSGGDRRRRVRGRRVDHHLRCRAAANWPSAAAGSATCPAGWPASAPAPRPPGPRRPRSTSAGSARPSSTINRP